jgi:hypothetical protein
MGESMSSSPKGPAHRAGNLSAFIIISLNFLRSNKKLNSLENSKELPYLLAEICIGAPERFLYLSLEIHIN